MLWVALVLIPFCQQKYSICTTRFSCKQFVNQLLADDMTEKMAGQKSESSECGMIEEAGVFQPSTHILKTGRVLEEGGADDGDYNFQ
jgi:hypothetical protein